MDSNAVTRVFWWRNSCGTVVTTAGMSDEEYLIVESGRHRNWLSIHKCHSVGRSLLLLLFVCLLEMWIMVILWRCWLTASIAVMAHGRMCHCRCYFPVRSFVNQIQFFFLLFQIVHVTKEIQNKENSLMNGVGNKCSLQYTNTRARLYLNSKTAQRSKQLWKLRVGQNVQRRVPSWLSGRRDLQVTTRGQRIIP